MLVRLYGKPLRISKIHRRPFHHAAPVQSQRRSAATTTTRGTLKPQKPLGLRELRTFDRLVPYLPSHVLKREYVAPSQHGPPNVAILGGGITGMATAFWLSKKSPQTQITIFEKESVLGGWIRSKIVDVPGGEVLFEQGPRSLRPAPPNGTLALRLIQELNLLPDLLVTSKSSAAARNRFVYYPDHLVRMPGPNQSLFSSLSTILFEPVFKGLFSALWRDSQTIGRPKDIKDESVGEFISRRADEALANNVASALFHGIYAGDIWKLSARSILSLPWHSEQKDGNMISSVIQSMRLGQYWRFCDDMHLQMKLNEFEWDPELANTIRSASVFTFNRGVGQLSERLEKVLSEMSNVRILKSTHVNAVRRVERGDVGVSYSPIENMHSHGKDSNSPETVTNTFTHLISTVSPNVLSPLIPQASPTESSKPSTTSEIASPIGQANFLERPPDALTDLSKRTKAPNVMVVNLYYTQSSLLLTCNPPGGVPSSLQGSGIQGFGYLLPLSLPFSENPERALGVIFDSDISPTQHATVSQEDLGTKLTVMMGGHWWDGWKEYPSAEESITMAKHVLERHLGISDEPAVAEANLQRNCIPQYEVGHHERCAKAHDALLELFPGGRLRVAGSWYSGVGVNDCIRAAWDVVQGLVHKEGGSEYPNNEPYSRRTGLEKFKLEKRPMVLVKRNKQTGEHVIMEVEQSGKDIGFFPEVKTSTAEDSEDNLF